jgi:hypothetical protein
MTPVLVFDIETIPDVEGMRKINLLDVAVDDEQIVSMAAQKRRQTVGHDFLPLYLQRVIAISCALRERDGLRVWSLGEPQDTEGDLIQRFFDGVEKYTPNLVSWNGAGFDLPVLHYRGLLSGVRAARYWDQGDGDHNDSRDFKWNNYIGRYHGRHLDLMDLLSLYQARATAPLDDFARLLGFPGKIGLDGSQVWRAWRDGDIAAIRSYCEADVVNTHLIYLRFQLMRGALSPDTYQRELDLVRSTVEKLPGPSWQDFLVRWPR